MVAVQGTLLLEHPLEGEGVGDDARTYAVVFEESFKLQNLLIHQRASSPPRGASEQRSEVLTAAQL